MKIAVPTNDRLTLAERSGRASEFAIIDINSNGIQSINYIENQHEKTHHNGESQHEHNHDERHGHEDIVALLSGIDVIIGKKFGPHFSRDFHNAGMKMKLTKIDNIEEAVKETFKNMK